MPATLQITCQPPAAARSELRPEFGTEFAQRHADARADPAEFRESMLPFLDTLPENAGPPNIYKRFPDLYRLWSQMSELLMNGPSPFSQQEREVLLAFAAGEMGCAFVLTGHSEVAYARGLPRGSIDALLADIETAPVEDRLRPVLRFVRHLARQPDDVTRAHVDAMFAAGWDEQAMHDAVAITARAAFMHRLVAGFGFGPLDPELAASHARKRVERGYVRLYSGFSER